jgi:hypothetical protein
MMTNFTWGLSKIITKLLILDKLNRGSFPIWETNMELILMKFDMMLS